MLEGHDDYVYGVAITPDGTQVVTASEDYTAIVWDLQTGSRLETLDHDDDLYAVAVSKDGTIFTAESSEYTAKMWRQVPVLDTPTYTWPHSDDVTSVAISADGTRAVTGDEDGYATVWDLRTGHHVTTLYVDDYRDVNGVALSADGSVVLTASDEYWDSDEGTYIGPVRMWNLTELPSSQYLREHIWTDHDDDLSDLYDDDQYGGSSSSAWAVAISPDGTKVASGGGDDGSTGLAIVRDLDSTAVLFVLDGHDADVRDLAWTPDGSKLVTVSDDETAKVWSMETGELLGTFHGHHDEIRSLAISPDGSKAVTGDWDLTAIVWDLNAVAAGSGSGGGSADDPPHLVILEDRYDYEDGWGGEEVVRDIAITPDGSKILTANFDATVKVWSMATGELLGKFYGHDHNVISVAITRDGTRAISSDWNGLIIVWNLTAVADAGVGSGDGDGDGSAWSYDSVLHVIRPETVDGDQDYVRDIVVSQDGGRMVTGSDNDEVVVWDLQTFDVVHRLAPGNDEINRVAMSQDGSTIVAVDGDGHAHWYRLGSGILPFQATPAFTLAHNDDVLSVAISPDGTKALAGDEDGFAKVWDLRTGKLLMSLEGHTDYVEGVAISPDGSVALTASEDETTRLWDLQTGRLMKVLKGHDDDVTSVAVAMDGTIVTGSDDNAVMVWKLHNVTSLQTEKTALEV